MYSVIGDIETVVHPFLLEGRVAHLSGGLPGFAILHVLEEGSRMRVSMDVLQPWVALVLDRVPVFLDLVSSWLVTVAVPAALRQSAILWANIMTLGA